MQHPSTENECAIERDAMFLQSGHKFFLEAHPLMMCLLIPYIFNDPRNERGTHTECRVAPAATQVFALLHAPIETNSI